MTPVVYEWMSLRWNEFKWMSLKVGPWDSSRKSEKGSNLFSENIYLHETTHKNTTGQWPTYAWVILYRK